MVNIRILIFFAFCIAFHSNGKAQTVLDKWENRNSEGKVNSIIKVYEKDSQVFGRIERIMKEEDRDRKCSACEGDLHNKPLEGLVIMRGLEKNGNIYENGVITDPESGKEYKCKIWLDPEDPDRLYVRGYLAFFYKTKIWERLD